MKEKSIKGITLVALVVTIIILLILAGVTITTLTQTGVFENAKQAKNAMENAQNEEEDILNEYNDKISSIIDLSNRSDLDDNQYSFEEKEIGTWIDGKKIYRKVYTGKITEYAQDIFTVPEPIEDLIDIKGYLKTSETNYKFPFNFTQNDSTQVAIFLKPDSKTIAYRGTDLGNYYIVLEYTKT